MSTVSNDLKFALGMIVFLLLSVVGMGVYAERLEGQVTQYKEQVQDEHTKVIETQLKYEQLRGEKENLERDLANHP